MDRRIYRRRKCKHCRQWFMPDHRTAFRALDPKANDSELVPYQRFCSAPACRRASHRYSQRILVLRTPDIYSGEAERVQAWRDEHPGYWLNQTKGRTFHIRARIRPHGRGKVLFQAWAHEYKTGTLHDLSDLQPVASACFRVVFVCALHDPSDFQFLHSYDSSRSSIGKGLSGASRPIRRRDRRKGWTGIAEMTVERLIPPRPDFLRRWLISITRPCCAAAAA